MTSRFSSLGTTNNKSHRVYTISPTSLHYLFLGRSRLIEITSFLKHFLCKLEARHHRIWPSPSFCQTRRDCRWTELVNVETTASKIRQGLTKDRVAHAQDAFRILTMQCSTTGSPAPQSTKWSTVVCSGSSNISLFTMTYLGPRLCNFFPSATMPCMPVGKPASIDAPSNRAMTSPTVAERMVMDGRTCSMSATITPFGISCMCPVFKKGPISRTHAILGHCLQMSDIA